MITIIKSNKGIAVEGHANYAPRGQDVVCASVSALFITLVNSLQMLADEDINVHIFEQVKIINYERLSEQGNLLVDAFFVGISGIAEEYPDYVTVEER